MSGGTGAAASPRLHDRRTELAAVAALSARVYAGSGGVLLITGSPGMGRTALLTQAVRDFDGVAHLVPAPPGNRVPWSGVRALLSVFGSTPAEVRHALRAARGPDGLVKALSRLSPGRRLLLCVDDHHLWDAHSRAALASAWSPGGGVPGVGWIVSFARHHRPPAVRGATVLRLERLDRAGASALLDDLCPVPAAEPVRERLLREAAGHPGILAAATRRLSWAQLAGAEPLPRSLTDGSVLGEVYGKLLDSLPVECRRLLALVAVAGDGPQEGPDERVVRAAGVARGASGGAASGEGASGGGGSAWAQGREAHELGLDGSVTGGPEFERPGSAGPESDGPWPRSAARESERSDGDGFASEPWGSDPRGRAVEASAVLAAARAARTSPEALDSLIADGLLKETRTTLRFADPFLRRAVLATTPVAWRRSTRALFTVEQDDDPPPRPRSVPHRQDASPGRALRLAEPSRPKRDAHPDRAAAARGAVPAPRTASASDGRTGRGRATAVQAFPLLPGLRHRADRFRAPEGVHARTDVVRGRAELARGLTALADGPVADAHQALLLAAALLEAEAPAEAADARLLAMEAAWAAGDPVACLIALGDADDDTDSSGWGSGSDSGSGSGSGSRDGYEVGERHSGASADAERDFLDGMRAALAARLPEARAPLARVVARDGEADDPRILLRAGSAALVLGDMASAARIHGRALAVVRAERRTALLPRVLEYLAYAELRAGRHARAGAHAREALQASRLTGQRNMAAHQHAVLALVASVTGHPDAVEEHAEKALDRARPHGLAQAITLAEWALARADLARGLGAQAAARLAQLVGPGPRGGHFALRMLAVPCYVEAAEAAGRTGEARAAAEEFAVWAAGGVDPHAPAQLARCRAVLAEPEEAAYWYGEAMRCHDESGSDFERARTLLSYGKWLRRRRRPLEARARLSDALVTFERAAAGVWADQARAELRATGGAIGGPRSPVTADGLTPQQQRIAWFAAEGATNREIADRLSISPRTVDHHLRNVFARLGVRSRVELSHALRRAEEGTTNP
ncbi:LuxR C-terminal-related transcriptional regulator [Streptomyces sp. NPDC002992]|uniref:helix-turn-helix transcriptional regulator n=1 Tax=Streptomyces sp. NPDC002992 TaxID=3154273 RepID=UPI00339E1E1B